MKLIGLIRSAESREIYGEGVTYGEARAAVEAQVSEGWEIKTFREE